MSAWHLRRTGIGLALILLGWPAWARPLPPSVTRTPRPVDVGAATGVAKTVPPAGIAGRDTVILLGGPGRQDGAFEDLLGASDWHGWTAVDHSTSADTFWTISTYNAEVLGGNGPGNHAMWCGTEFPDGNHGYGNDWKQYLGWQWPVADLNAPVTARLAARLNHDTEPGFDQLHLQSWRGDGWRTEETWDGWRLDRRVELTVTFVPEDLGGPDGDQLRFRFAFLSDETWSDEDGLYPTDGACQIDDIKVYLADTLTTLDDFEPGSAIHWLPTDFTGAGAFAQLFRNLEDADGCRGNRTSVVAFVDDGLVVPGTGGSPCQTWCYGPGGFVVNSRGGLLGADAGLDNAVMSPPLAWPEGNDDLLLAFDAYVHEPLVATSPGIVYRWRVRSTADEDVASLDSATWRSRDVVYHGGPRWVRHRESCGDLLVAARRWIQVELEVLDFGSVWELDGDDGTPAPYFDNVALRAFPAAGPRIVVDDLHLPQDAFPEFADLDLENPVRNWCRFDMARNISPAEHLRLDPGDSVVAEVHLLRPGAELVAPPRLVVRLQANPVFTDGRLEAPGADGVLMLEAVGDSCRDAGGQVVAGRWAFDLPDTGLIFPGDELRFFIEARTMAAGGEAVTTWPADTAGFGGDSGELGTWPALATMRALPSVRSLTPGDQPTLLFWQDYPARTTGRDLWDHALRTLGLQLGQDYDWYRTREPAVGSGNGLGGRATVDQLASYTTLLYDSGNMIRHTLAGGDWNSDPSADRQLLTAWLDTGNRRAFLAGDNLVSDVAAGGLEGSLFLSDVLGITSIGPDAQRVLDGQFAPVVAARDGNSVFSDLGRWRPSGACPERRTFDLVVTSGAESLAEFTTPGGQGGAYPYAAGSRYLSAMPVRDVISLPYSLTAIHEAEADDLPVASRVRLLAEVLVALGEVLPELVAVPLPPGQLAVSNQPNPFNPRTTIVYEVPATGHVSLTVVDLRGRLVRTLVDEVRPIGVDQVIWDGQDDRGRSCASGLYFHVLRAAGASRLGKMTLIR